jgi:hypothetical protein
MSYEIFYDRRFILLDGDKYIPIVQHGSNNCWEKNWRGQDIPAKNWSVSNYPKHDQFIFNPQEIRELAKIQGKFENFKSRHRSFAPGEYERWFVNGMKNAKPLEFYLEYGNTLRIVEHKKYPDANYYYPKTEKELLEMITDLTKMGNRPSIGFVERNLTLPKRKKTTREKQKYPYFYALANQGAYLVKLTRYGYRYVGYPGPGVVKKFKTESEAKKYLKKYAGRLSGFKPVKVEEACFI